MRDYLAYFIGPIGQGAFLFLFSFPAIVFITHLIMHRKRFSLFKKIGMYLLMLFLFLAAGLVFFPFPEFWPNYCQSRIELLNWQTDLFQRIKDVKDFALEHQVALWKNKALFQVIFNLFLLMPIGMIGKAIFQRKWPKILVISFLLSLCFELLQGSAIFGLLPCPYRLFDVDDLWLNTLWAVFGGLLILPFSKKIQKLIKHKDYLITQDNYLIKRIVAYGIDSITIVLLTLVLDNVGLLLLPNFRETFENEIFHIMTLLMTQILYFGFLARKRNGHTLGKKLMKIKVISQYWNPARLIQLLIRSILPVFSLAIISLITQSIEHWTGVSLSQNGIYWLLLFMYVLIFIPLSIELSRDGRALHDKMAGTRVTAA